MTMKKINVKVAKTTSHSCCESDRTSQLHSSQCCHPVPFRSRQKQSPTSALSSREGLQSSETLSPSSTNDNHSQVSQNRLASCSVSSERTSRRQNKVGFLHSLRKRLSTLSVKSLNTESSEHSGRAGDTGRPQSNTPSFSRPKLGIKYKLCPDVGAVSQSCDNLTSPAVDGRLPAHNKWHSHTDCCQLELPSTGTFVCPDTNTSISSYPCHESASEDCVSDCTGVKTGTHKEEKKSCSSELADCIQYDPVKEQTTIFSPKVWSLTQELFRLSKFGWYWGPITRNEAEDKLINQADGAFLVRDSSDERYLLSLSFRSSGHILHTRIEHCNGMFSFYAQPDTEGYPSIVDLIEHSMSESNAGTFYYSRSRSTGAPQFPVRLTTPVSRYTQIRSLQYLCRFVIRQHTRYDHIQQLPLPSRLKHWIEENQY